MDSNKIVDFFISVHLASAELFFSVQGEAAGLGNGDTQLFYGTFDHIPLSLSHSSYLPLF